MELLIPGLILVALMVYASTRIKRVASEAFDPEIVDTPHLIIKKPEGMLTVLNGDERYDFESYSKEYGGHEAENVRRATAFLERLDGKKLDTAARDVLSAGEKVSDIAETIGGHKVRLIETKDSSAGVPMRDIYKLIEKDGAVLKFHAAVIDEPGSDLVRKIEKMVDDIEIK